MNVLVRPSGKSDGRFVVKLSDLEFTKIISDGSSGSGGQHASTSFAAGTKNWQAPEAKAGVKNTKRSDVFSLGP